MADNSKQRQTEVEEEEKQYRTEPVENFVNQKKRCHFVWFAAQNFVTSMDSHWNGSNATIIYVSPSPAGIPHSVPWIQSSWPPLLSQRAEVHSLYCHTIKWVYPAFLWIRPKLSKQRKWEEIPILVALAVCDACSVQWDLDGGDYIYSWIQFL